MRSFDGLDVQVAHTIMLADGRIPRVRQRTRALVAEPGHVVLVPAARAKTNKKKTTAKVSRYDTHARGSGGGAHSVLRNSTQGTTANVKPNTLTYYSQRCRMPR